MGAVTLRLATRRSRLAMAQTSLVARRLVAALAIEVELVPITSAGDHDQTTGIAHLTETGAFVRALQLAVLSGRADAAVHSAKDLPVASPPGLVIAAYPERASPADVLVGATLRSLPRGATVGTGSPRRRSQLLLLRGDLETVELRGNIDTRLRRIGDTVDGAVLAEAGLLRLDRGDIVAQRFDIEEMVPAPGQGALAVETRAGGETERLVRLIDDPAVRVEVEAERALLEATGAGCRSALGALARSSPGHGLRIVGFVSDDRGPRRAVVDADDAAAGVRSLLRELAV